MVRVRESLYIAVIRDGDRLVPPLHGAFYNILDIRDAIHIAHLRMAVQFHALLRAGVCTGGRKIRNLFDADHRTDRKLTVELVNRRHPLDLQECSFGESPVKQFLQLIVSGKDF